MKTASVTTSSEQGQKYLELILQSAGIGTCEWNIKTGESVYNERWAEIIGYTKQELAPTLTTWEENTHPEDLQRAYAALQQHFYEKTPYYSVETRMKHKNGSWVWVLNSGRVIEWDTEGQPQKMFITHIDINKLKVAETKLRENERRFQLAFECAAVGLWDLDLQTQEMYITPEYKQILGYAVDEAEEGYEFWRKRWHPEDRERLESVMQAFIKGKIPRFEVPHRLLNKAGQWQWLMARGGIFTNAQGQKHFIGTLADITYLMRVREKNEELEGIFAVNPDLLCIADLAGRLLKVNAAWTETLGYSIEQLVGSEFLTLVHPEDLEATKAAMISLGKQEQLLGFVNRYRHLDGSYRYLDWRVHPYGQTLFSVARDVTASIEQEQQLKNNLAIKTAHLQLTQLKDISLEELFAKSLEEIIAITSSKIGYIFLYDEQKQEFLLHNWSQTVLEECRVHEQKRLYSLPNVGLWGEAVRQRKEIIINDYKNYLGQKHGCPEGHLQIDKFLSLPVIDREKIVAVVGVANKKSDYSQDDVFNLQMLMNVVWAQSERLRTEQQLAREQAIFAATVLSIQEAVIVTDDLGKVLVVNTVAETLTGWSKADALGRDLEEILELREAITKQPADNPAKLVLASRQAIVSPENIFLVAKDGREYYIAGHAAPVLDKNGVLIGTAINFRDITENWLKQKETEYYSSRDALTGAYNRLYFERRIAEELERADRYQELMAMAILDLDRFKLVNDTWGHPVGDAVLRRTAEVITEIIRNTDYLVRLGGEEFIIVMPNTDSVGAMLVAEKIRQALEANNHPQAGRVTASLGVAERMQSESFATWYKRVDQALYEAKNSGRNRVVMATEEMLPPQNYLQLQWDSKWNSGDGQIDAEHQELLALGNQLIYLAFSGATAATISQQLELVLQHVEQHFRHEEIILEKIAYPELKRHQKTHRNLLGKAAKLKAAQERQELKPAAFFSFIVDEVIVKHMMTEDVLFFSLLRATQQEKAI